MSQTPPLPIPPLPTPPLPTPPLPTPPLPTPPLPTPPLPTPPLPTSRTPVVEARVKGEHADNGLVIGISCGALGFFAIITIFILIFIKVRKKHKARDENAFCESPYRSDARLLSNGQAQNDLKQNNSLLFDEQKSFSCPDIYQANKSNLLKLGPTAHSYGHLQQDNTMNNVTNTRSSISLTNPSNKLSRDEPEGKIFDDESHLYHIPSVSKTFPKQPDIPSQSNKHTKMELHPTGNHINMSVYNATNEYPSDNDMSDNGTHLIGHQTPTPNSPKLITKPNIIEVVPNQTELDDQNNIYDIPKLGDPQFKGDERYKVPLNTIILDIPRQGDKQRSSSVGTATNSALSDDNRLYEVPSNIRPSYDIPSTKPGTYHSQPSLLEMNSNETKHKLDEHKDTNNHVDNIPISYDVPSKCQTEGSFLKSPTKESKDALCNLGNERSLYNDTNDNGNSKCNKNNYNTNTNNHNNNYNHNDNGRVDFIPKTEYDVPHSLGIDSSVRTNDDSATYKNITSTVERRRSNGLIKKIGYDVPSTIPIFDPSQPSLLKLASKTLYKNIDTPSNNKTKFGIAATAYDVPDNKTKFDIAATAYDVPASIPDYNPEDSFSKVPVNKKMATQGNRSKHFDADDIIYDVPSNSKLLSNMESSENNEMTSCNIDDDDQIYQNIYQSEDGRQCLRTYNPANHT